MGRIISGTPPELITTPFGYGMVRIFKESGTFTVPPGVRKLRVSLLAAGSGGLASCHNSSASASPNYGGTGGGFASKVFAVTPGDSFNYLVGAGGVGRVIFGGVTISQNATAGGDTSFGTVFSATGGGVAVVNGSSGVPGVGIGGDINYTGGNSGTYNSGTITGVGVTHALGGGAAASAYGNGGNGGSVGAITNTPTVQVRAAATGGGAVGGFKGGDIKGYAGSTEQYVASGSAGTGGDAQQPTSGGAAASEYPGGLGNVLYAAFSGEDTSAAPQIPGWHILLPLIGKGQTVTYSTNRWTVAANSVARGAGTAGILATSAYNNVIAASDAVVCGGGGGAVHMGTADGLNATGGAGGYGGGGGAACAASGLNTYIRGGKGGNGLVIVEF